jgi:hypothetical protein
MVMQFLLNTEMKEVLSLNRTQVPFWIQNYQFIGEVRSVEASLAKCLPHGEVDLLPQHLMRNQATTGQWSPCRHSKMKKGRKEARAEKVESGLKSLTVVNDSPPLFSSTIAIFNHLATSDTL